MEGLLKRWQKVLWLQLLWCLTSCKPAVPVLAEDRVIEDNLLQQLNQLVGQVCSHEGLDCDRHLLWVLGLRQRCLHHLRWDKIRKKTKINIEKQHSFAVRGGVGGHLTWSMSCLLKGLFSSNTFAQSSGSFRRTRYRASLLNNEFSLHTWEGKIWSD